MWMKESTEIMVQQPDEKASAHSALTLFYCYAHKDKALRDEIDVHLAALHRSHLITSWHDAMIIPGMNWEHEIETHLNTASIVLLLVSPDFLNSDYCYGQEMQFAIERHTRGEAQVIPILLRPVDWEDTPFSTLQMLPTDARPVTEWPNCDAAFADIAHGIRRAVNAIIAQKRLQEEEQKRLQVKTPKASVTKNLKNDLVPSRSLLPFGMNLCPSCIQEFYPGECRIMSRKTSGKVLKSPAHGWLAQHMKPQPLTSSYYREEDACRECPHCHYLLPYNIEQVDNISIAIIGNTFSGKSMYLAALLDQIKHRWVKKSKSLKISCLTEDIEDDYNHEYSIPLFDQHRVLNATQPGVTSYMKPLIYELTVSASSRSQERKVNLIFYDGSGEDYSNRFRMEHYSRYVLRASAIILLVDPFVTFVDHLSDRFHPSMLNVLRDLSTSQFLETTIELLKDYYPSAFHSIPFAIMLSKSDLLKEIYRQTDPIFRYLTDLSNHYLDLQDIEDIDTIVRTLIRETREYPLLEVVQHFSKTGFFVSSATGCSPDPLGNFPFIKPCHCLDPLLWILHQLGIIPEGDSL